MLKAINMKISTIMAIASPEKTQTHTTYRAHNSKKTLNKLNKYKLNK